MVVGAGGGIGRAVAERLLHGGWQVLGVSRQPQSINHPQLSWYNGASDETEIEQLVAQLEDFRGRIQRVVVCSGVLHSDAQALAPEKRLEELTAHGLMSTMAVNTLLPGLWLARLLPLLKDSPHCVYATLSARVGSIGDNRLGGWYSYRASKAALNMLLQTAAVEYSRRARRVKLLAFHPGTTDTQLSRPFQGNVPHGKLFTPEFVATQMDRIMSGLQADGELSYLDWQGKAIPW
nr:SDR family NAD(P)-dependent oxidoreductase [Pseudomaricurvus sp. HS19]